MPLFNLKCNQCNLIQRRLLSHFEVIKEVDFRCLCGGLFVKMNGGPSTQVMERLDNGAMPRAVERYTDAEELFKERHLNADPLAGTKKNYS